MQNRAQEVEQLSQTLNEKMGLAINPSLPISLLERMAAARLQVGDYNNVVNFLAPVFKDEPIVIFGGRGGSTDAAFAAQHLAMAYQKMGQKEQAARILTRLENELLHREQEGFLRDPLWISILARNLIIQNRHDEALSRLSKAIKLGWRSFYQIQYDPIWEPIRQNAKFQKLMSSVKSDIERQRQNLMSFENL